MIWTLLTGNPIARLLAKIGGLILLVVTFGAYQRWKGEQAQKAKQAEAVAKGVQAGAKGAAKAEADLRAGKTPQQVKEANDAKWN